MKKLSPLRQKDIRTGAKQERERIIALLKSTDLLTTIEGGALVNYAETAIALINGLNATDFAGSTLPISQGENE